MVMLEDNLGLSLLWVLSVIVFGYVLKLCYHNLRMLLMVEKFGGPPTNSFILGNINYVLQSTEKLLSSAEEDSITYYPHFRLRLFNYGIVHIFSPEDIEIVLSSKKNSNKSDAYYVLKTWLGEGLLLSAGKKWAQRRKILTPAFHFSILKNFMPIFNEHSENFLESISQNLGNPIDVEPIAHEFTLSTIAETAMGHTLIGDDLDPEEYMKSIKEAEKIFEYRLFRPWIWYRIVYFFTRTCWLEYKLLKKLHTFTRNIINKRMESFIPFSAIDFLPKREENDLDNMYITKTKRRFAMLDILLQAKVDGEQIDYDGICEEVDTFMFEGHDTTGAAIGYCLMLLANNPEIQEEAHKEIEEVLGGRKEVTINDLKELDLLERCIKETLRLYPSVFFISRTVDEDTVLHSGLVMPKDSIATVVISAVHKHPNLYSNPQVFDPDRFKLENSKDRHPFAYIPFSAGPRNCIGQKFAMMELKTLIARILQNFKLLAIDTPDTIELKPGILLRPKNGIKVIFEPR